MRVVGLENTHKEGFPMAQLFPHLQLSNVDFSYPWVKTINEPLGT